MGPYPLFGCANWSGIADDLARVDDSLVSLVLVADPLAAIEESELRRAFPDHLVPLKPHLIRDLHEPASLPAHHRRRLRGAAGAVEVEVCAEPLEHLDDWMRLYGDLVARHRLSGVRAFSRAAFRQQLALPGVVAVRAERHGLTVGMTIWFEDAPNAYYHLGAYSREGYAVSASYALFAVALDHLRDRGVRRVDLGGGAGAGSAGDGLVRFKSGWANGQRIAHLCGRILNRPAYERLAERAGGSATSWFPAYRANDPDLAGGANGSGARMTSSTYAASSAATTRPLALSDAAEDGWTWS
ncbi:MAG: GNAT family N-acetyltransferase [Actinomycetota bacterium]|nr:GNAT family N-acetyltransferase [Actinomycetota bacterium]